MDINIFDVCKIDNSKILEKSIKDRNIDTEIKNNDDQTLLAYACSIGSVKIVEFLLDEGSEVNTLDKYHQTPLLLACLGNYSNIVRLLLNKDADMEISDKYGASAVMWASGKGNLEIIKILIEKGANIHRTDKNGWTALLYACTRNRIEVTRELLRQQSDVNIITESGTSPLMHLAERGNKDLVKTFLSRGANPRTTDEEGKFFYEYFYSPIDKNEIKDYVEEKYPGPISCEIIMDVIDNEYNDTYTITFGEQVENHVGMEMIGRLSDEGFDVLEMSEAEYEFQCRGCQCEMIDLTSNLPEEQIDDSLSACVLVIRDGVKVFTDPDELYEEQSNLRWDKKAKQYGRVVNKRARWNLCFSDFDQEPNYEEGMGRVVSFEHLPCLSEIRKYLHSYLGEKGIDLLAEGNYYYDPKTTGIGWHGDFERKIVVAVRLGVSTPLRYQWFHKGEPLGERIDILLNHGDMYIMSEKATGQDWKKKNIPTLRHCAGADKFAVIKKKK